MRAGVRYLVKAVLSAGSRDRFGRTESVILAVSVGIVLIRGISYLALALLEYPDIEKTTFVSVSIATIASLWGVLGVLTIVESSRRSAPTLFFSNTHRSALLLRQWYAVGIVARPLTVALLVYAAVGVAISRQPVDAILPVVLSVVSALGASGVYLIVPASVAEHGTLSRFAVIAAMYLAVLGPDFTVSSGTMVPVIFRVPLPNETMSVGWLYAFLPYPLLFLMPAIGWIRDRTMHRGVLKGRVGPLARLFLAQTSLGYWVFLIVVLAVVRLAANRIVLTVSLAFASGTAVLLVFGINTVSHIQEHWGIAKPGRAFVRQAAGVSLAFMLVHAVVAFAVYLWV